MSADPFVYHAPTPITAPKYAAIRAAEAAAHSACYHATETPDATLSCDDVNAACQAFEATIEEHAPGSADKSAALRCVRLARMAANEEIAELRTGGPSSDALLRQCHDNLRAARWQACAAVALHDWEA